MSQRLSSQVFAVLSRSRMLFDLAVFLESTVFWLYLNFFGRLLRLIVGSQSSSLDPSLKTFACAFLADYIWRRLLAVGHCIDPGVCLIEFVSTPVRTSRRKARFAAFVTSCVSCGAAALVVLVVSEAIAETRYASWKRSALGLVGCFFVEFVCCLCHQNRNAAWLVFCDSAKQLKLRQQTGPSNASKKQDVPSSSELNWEKELTEQGLCIKARGVHVTASMLTAAIVTFGGAFTHGGPMLNISYTIMAALAQKDLTMLVVLGTANLLAAYVAAKYTFIRAELPTTQQSSNKLQ